ncbi:MAG: hypothetical protein JNK53_09035 [Phycisphaerae bacterium]|nr:hypothetical protein [Phycisphaerae bacterium]
MSTQVHLDLAIAHKFFSAECFNKTWELMKQAERTPEEEVLMVSLSHASLYHWSQRADCQPINISIAFWQLSRVNALLGRPTDAYGYAVLCLAKSDALPPYYRGYAYEALARSEKLSGNASAAAAHIAMARSLATLVESQQDRDVLLNDLAQIEAA